MKPDSEKAPEWAAKALSDVVGAKRLASLDEAGKAEALMAVRLISAAKYAAHEAARLGTLKCGETMPTNERLEAATRLLNSLFADYGLIPVVQDDALLTKAPETTTGDSSPASSSAVASVDEQSSLF